MTDNLAELLYMAWRSALLSSAPDLPSWGNVRDPDVRGAWEAAATKARTEITERNANKLGNAAVEALSNADTRELAKGLAFGAQRILRGVG